ncbi:hypothetical protein BH23GEM6_BH23GEM6_11820 [soil metagenome]
MAYVDRLRDAGWVAGVFRTVPTSADVRGSADQWTSPAPIIFRENLARGVRRRLADFPLSRGSPAICVFAHLRLPSVITVITVIAIESHLSAPLCRSLAPRPSLTLRLLRPRPARLSVPLQCQVPSGLPGPSPCSRRPPGMVRFSSSLDELGSACLFNGPLDPHISVDPRAAGQVPGPMAGGG